MSKGIEVAVFSVSVRQKLAVTFPHTPTSKAISGKSYSNCLEATCLRRHQYSALCACFKWVLQSLSVSWQPGFWALNGHSTTTKHLFQNTYQGPCWHKRTTKHAYNSTHACTHSFNAKWIWVPIILEKASKIWWWHFVTIWATGKVLHQQRVRGWFFLILKYFPLPWVFCCTETCLHQESPHTTDATALQANMCTELRQDEARQTLCLHYWCSNPVRDEGFLRD